MEGQAIMDYKQILLELARWFWKLLAGASNLISFLFTPISQTIENITLPSWVTTALGWLQGIFGVDVVPIALIGVTGIIIAVIVAIVKAFI